MTAERKQAEEILDMYWDDPINVKYECALRAMESYAPLRVAEATKGMYPRSFVEWKDMYVQFYAYGNIYEVRSTDKHFVGLESLFEYWKKHKQ
ncbi:MAG: hypothetical protein BWX49_00006 [Bacteroidetes bacterium ADurb.Bin008]|jgi:hypothetical protein|nr:MAG: hypothetical protein BWX49_00006 [Bacteroidetes bacterium ADurb.Bin008]